MTQDMTILTLRSMAFRLDGRHLKRLFKKDKFRDLVRAGSLLNAIIYSRQYVPYELAKFQMAKKSTRRIIHLTGGLLFDAFALLEAMNRKYTDSPHTWNMNSVLKSYELCDPPEVYLDMRAFGLFRLYPEPEHTGYVRNLGTSGQDLLLKPKQPATPGIEVARISDYNLTKDELMVREVHPDIESMVETTVADVLLALEEFICGMAQDLGLHNIKMSDKAA